jgi:hypothetical protein
MKSKQKRLFFKRHYRINFNWKKRRKFNSFPLHPNAYLTFTQLNKNENYENPAVYVHAHLTGAAAAHAKATQQQQ